MKKIVIDTSILIDYSRTQRGMYIDLYRNFSKGLLELYVPTAVIAEFWAGQEMSRKVNVKKGEELFSELMRVGLSEKIAKRTGELIRKKQVKGFDAIIAATALEIKAEIATRNTKHFEDIKGLKLFKLQK